MKRTTPEDEMRGDPPSHDEAVAKLRLQLRHVSLQELEEEGLVTWERNNHVVKRGPQFDEKRPEWRID